MVQAIYCLIIYRKMVATLVLHFQTLGTPTVAVITLVMAGSLAQMPAVVAAGGKLERGGDEVLWDMRRFYFIAGALHILCRLILVSCATRPVKTKTRW